MGRVRRRGAQGGGGGGGGGCSAACSACLHHAWLAHLQLHACTPRTNHAVHVERKHFSASLQPGTSAVAQHPPSPPDLTPPGPYLKFDSWPQLRTPCASLSYRDLAACEGLLVELQALGANLELKGQVVRTRMSAASIASSQALASPLSSTRPTPSPRPLAFMRAGSQHAREEGPPVAGNPGLYGMAKLGSVCRRVAEDEPVVEDDSLWDAGVGAPSLGRSMLHRFGSLASRVSDESPTPPLAAASSGGSPNAARPCPSPCAGQPLMRRLESSGSVMGTGLADVGHGPSEEVLLFMGSPRVFNMEQLQVRVPV